MPIVQSFLAVWVSPDPYCIKEVDLVIAQIAESFRFTPNQIRG